MRITSVEKWKVVVPCREGVLERAGRWYDPGLSTFDSVPKWIVRIHTDTGMCGLGESSRGEPEANIDAGIAALLGRDPRAFPLQALPLPPPADYSTFEMALVDLLGRAWEVPAYQLLGGARQQGVLVDYWCSRLSPEGTARHAARGRSLGFRGIKIKAALAIPGARRRGYAPAGSPGDHSQWAAVHQDDPVVERVAAIAEAAGSDFTVTIDPNCRFYEPAAVLKLGRDLERYNVLALEDPIPWRDNLDAYRLLRQRCPVPLAIHVTSPEGVLAAVRSGAVDYMNLAGSMVEFVRMAWLAELAGIRCWHGSGVDLGIRDMSYVHASLAAGNCTLPGDMVGNFLREDDLIVEPIPIDGGVACPTAAPGLGVTLDEAALERYRAPREEG